MNFKVLLLILASLSLILAFRLITFIANYEPYPEGKHISFESSLSASPKISIKGQKFSLIMPNAQRVSITIDHKVPLSYGDRIKVDGRVEYFNTEDGDSVAYMSYPRYELIEESRHSLIYKFRVNIVNFYNTSLSPEHSSLIAGMTFGIKGDMPEDFFDELQRTGLLHVVAASGMNITMVGGFMLVLFGSILRRQVAVMATVLGILIYALLAGLEPSIVRASIMGILVLLAQLTGRQNSAFLGLFFAGFTMLMINPSLVLDIGFQLSFMATLGLIYLRPLFEFKKGKIRKSVLASDFFTTLTAQLATMPILLFNFGSYSPLSILVNAILLWTVPIIMILGAISALVSLLIEPFGRLVLFLSVPFLYFFTSVVSLFSNSRIQIDLERTSSFLAVGYYLLLTSFMIYKNKKK
jgi:competence protein ComEC